MKKILKKGLLSLILGINYFSTNNLPVYELQDNNSLTSYKSDFSAKGLVGTGLVCLVGYTIIKKCRKKQ